VDDNQKPTNQREDMKREKPNGRKLNQFRPSHMKFRPYCIHDLLNPTDYFTKVIDRKNPLGDQHNDLGTYIHNHDTSDFEWRNEIRLNNDWDSRFPKLNPDQFINPLTGRSAVDCFDFR
jgi:hypothetical protein